MTRRKVVSALAASALPLGAAEPGRAPVFYELTTYRLHNSNEQQSSRLSRFLQSAYQPALRRAGAELSGAFAPVIAPDSPFLLTIAQFSTLTEYQNAAAKLSADADYQQQLSALDAGEGLPYVRFESSLLRAFDSMPAPLLASRETGKQARIFEWRTYESHTRVTLARKVRMFNEGEIGIFQRLGMRPVLFGETLVGPRQPNLMYFLSFDDLTARMQLWSQFVADPEWKRISAPREVHDAAIVSNISNVILRPLDFSAMQ